jgi:hypothetical protein
LERLHWMVVIPMYFFTAMTLLALFILVARLLRARVSLDPLVASACALALGLAVGPLVVGWATLDAYTGRVVLGLIVVSLALTGLDTILRSPLPLPLDEELREDGRPKTHQTGIA